MRYILVLLYAIITLALTSQLALALDPEERVLLPKTGRSPAEAGLESGRYRELEEKEIKGWEKKQNESLDREEAERLPAKSEGQDFPVKGSRPKL